MLKRIFFLIAIVFSANLVVLGQVTTSAMGGFVKSAAGEPLVGATVTATHVPTGSVHTTVARTNGRFDISNMTPGGPYTISVSFVGYQTFVRNDVYLALGENSKQDFQLGGNAVELTSVVVAATRAAAAQGKGGMETTIGRDKMTNMPTVSRNITDYLRATPQAKLGTTEGSITIAGQNNRYNAFYVDGAVNNDVFGLAASGTNGGQANVAPISMDAIDQIQVVISPFDASLGNFTGGGINAITRSGTNTVTGSAYYLFRNEKLAGKTPTGPKENAVKFPPFKNQTYGFRIGGPIVKNKIFFFLNGEMQRDNRPQPFQVSNYRGNTNEAGLNALADYLRNTYGYDPGGFANNAETVKADRIVAKLDFNLNPKNRLSVSYRYNNGERYNATSSSSSTINFYNDGYLFPSTSHSASAELKTSLKRGASNKLLVTYTNVKDDRGPQGGAFPRVSITDGSGSIIFGPDNSSTINLLTQKNYTLFDVYKIPLGKHGLSVGTDNELNDVYNAFIQNTFGNYAYASLADFYNNAKPSTYQVGYSLIDNKTDETTAAAAAFKTLKLGFFVNDEIKVNDKLTLNLGVRGDYFSFLTTPLTDDVTNNVSLPVFEANYDMQGARSGQKPKIPVSISPRFGFIYKMPEEKLTLRGGVGLFTGRVPLVWPGGIYNSNGISVGGFSANANQNANLLNTIRFRADPYNQWRPSDFPGFSTTAKGALNLISKEFKLPKLFRISLAADKQLGKGWTATIEGLFNKNINEIYYTNFNIAPPTLTSVAPGSHTVYNATNTLVIPGFAANPYDNGVLLRNATGSKGYSYNFSGTIDKRFASNWSVTVSYSYGASVVVHEQTSSVNYSQWRFVESVNGRNFLGRSISDFDQGHRIFAYASKKFEYWQKKLATTISLVYNGQSGQPFSYVYGTNGVVRDAAQSGGFSSDLVYVPTSTEVNSMTFLSNTVNGVTYTQADQRAAFDAFISGNKYLNKSRGTFADRNADRLPFQHVIDLKLAEDVNFKIAGKTYQFQITYDIFNFTNMLNRAWGKTYFLLNDQYRLLEFGGYVSTTNLTPQYRFNPTLAQPQSIANISTSSAPSFSPRWTSQLGIRFNF